MHAMGIAIPGARSTGLMGFGIGPDRNRIVKNLRIGRAC
jgi:hypothetical protein